MKYIVTGPPPDDVLQHGRRGEREGEAGLGQQVDVHYQIGAAATALASRSPRYSDNRGVAPCSRSDDPR